MATKVLSTAKQVWLRFWNYKSILPRKYLYSIYRTKITIYYKNIRPLVILPILTWYLQQKVFDHSLVETIGETPPTFLNAFWSLLASFIGILVISVISTFATADNNFNILFAFEPRRCCCTLFRECQPLNRATWSSVTWFQVSSVSLYASHLVAVKWYGFKHQSRSRFP